MVNQNIKVCRASAGSGKTFALVSEYIARAIDSASGSPAFAPILAITFTNKATGEMKMRILNTLKSIAGGEARSDAYVGAIRGLMGGRISEEEIRRRCGATLAAILDNYDYFDVKTIDSFFQRIISDIAVMIGYETELQVFLGDDEAVDGAVDSLVSEAASGSNKTLTALIENYISLNAEDSDTWDFRKELKRFGTNVCQEIYMRNSARIDTTLGKLDTFTKIYKALSKERKTAADNIAFVKFQQYLFDRQWQTLHDLAASKGVRIFGDMPLYLAQNSADVWAEDQSGTADSVVGRDAGVREEEE